MILLAVVASGSAVVGYVFRSRSTSDAEFQHQAQVARAKAVQLREQTVLPAETKLTRGENFVDALQKSGLSAGDAANASAAAQRAFNLRQVRAGNTLIVNRSAEGALREIDY